MGMLFVIEYKIHNSVSHFSFWALCRKEEQWPGIVA